MNKTSARRRIWLSVLLGVIACLITALVFINRRLIRSLIKGEKPREPFRWLPERGARPDEPAAEAAEGQPSAEEDPAA